MQKIYRITLLAALIFTTNAFADKKPVDYVNPYMGNISHLLQPTYPTVHLPNGMLRIYPQRGNYTESTIHGLPIIVVNHRENCCFNLSAFQGEESRLAPTVSTDYDNEQITPYYYRTELDEQQVKAEFSPAYRAAIYRIEYREDKPAYLVLNSGNGELEIEDNVIKGYQNTWGNTKVYIYFETDTRPQKSGVLKGNTLDTGNSKIAGQNSCAVFCFKNNACINAKYGISFISIEQAKKNMDNEIPDFDFDKIRKQGRKIWNKTLGKIIVKGGSENDKYVFYTSLYRCYERPVNISEDGHYYSAADRKVHNDGGHAFYTDDWLWDTYRAAHPLRILLDADIENDIIISFIRTAEQSDKQWFPTFPSITGDSRRMNCNHGVAVIADAWEKGIRNFDLQKAYEYGRKGIEEKTLAPWSSCEAGLLNDFYAKNGYVPALTPDEEETLPEVNRFEKRQPIPVTLGTAYDQWCLSRIASALNKKDDARHYLKCSYNYRNVFNSRTSFFHPKDRNGNFIEPFDYRFSGGLGAREYYDENNGWTYRWDVQHNIGDLIALMGGAEMFDRNLDQTFNEWLGRSKFEFYAQLPDQTGNVGQFSMANEPSLHIPYLYNYAGKPYKTQKRIRALIHQWFRNDLMGVPGDEDGGGLSSFVVFSMMGFYPVTPGSPYYNIGSPFFKKIKIKLDNGKTFHIIGKKCSEENKYIQSATLNGEKWDKAFFGHEQIKEGGKLKFIMGNKCHTQWGANEAPPSALPYPTD